MTDRRYLPEGMRLGTAENLAYTASPEALRRAMMQGRILEGIAGMCDSASMDLTVDLGCAVGIIRREDAVYMHDGSSCRDIAILTRVGKPVCFKVMGMEQSGPRPIVHLSRRAAQEECMREALLTRKPGDILTVRVTHLEPFGAFVDIGCGIVSLITVDCLSVSRISHPSDRLTPGETASAVVKSIDAQSGRIYMTQRELLGTWEENASLFRPTQTVAGIVRSVEEYGIFIELAPNLAGLAEVREGVSVGDRCAVYIKSIIPEKMKIKLVIIDTHAQCGGASAGYFVDTASVSHISYWRYSPYNCSKVIETHFDALPVSAGIQK